ncbi:glycosyltransferase family 2 protein [Corynebacterium sp. CCM 9185]|uniref:Glycosyltransferase family 2 protein n=1 Tax=Corynebacterium marambiense TaxID=2765364 RepID=A0ABS0VSN7_9CORY|nr:glycosyltransferase family 2 protein [Corynebacterium marambiense]MBI8999786.1 glycosyltransferase family 2 protein [Corynebacterium marambiense]MCK7662626.1 glycosyltransferase family 2 protein [Corynebacterium marambiense]MCX7543635.1 glycosyltransferase family 2 protein [Corynebacterium marambiense]
MMSPGSSDRPGAGAQEISIIVPAGHDAELLRRCLDALDRQTIPVREVIVVTDPGTPSGVSGVAAAHDVITVSTDQYVLPTWTGFDAASGTVLLRVNPRSNPAPDHLVRLISAWDRACTQTPGFTVVGVSGPTRFEIPGWRGDLLSGVYRRAHGASVGRILGHQPFYGTNYSLRRDWWCSVRRSVREAGVRVSEDVHLSFAVRPGETIWYAPELCVAARPGPGVPGKVRDGVRTLAVNLLSESPTTRRWDRSSVEEER